MSAQQLSPGPTPRTTEDTRPYACLICVQRKVKCDKRQPCLSCTRSRLTCKYRNITPSQRRKRKAEEWNQTLLDRLRSHEAALRNAGIPFENFDVMSAPNEESLDLDEGRNEMVEISHSLTLRPSGPGENSAVVTKSPRRRPPGILISEYGGRRFYQHGLLGVLGQEYRQDPIDSMTKQQTIQQTAQEPYSDIVVSSMVLNGPSTTALAGQKYRHPPGTTVMKYWSIFVDNVHPLTKIIHAPSVHQLMIKPPPYSSKISDALRCSIYACAVASLTDRDCQRMFGGHHASLLNEYQSATRSALLESSFLQIPSLDLLRANVLLLTSMFHSSPPSSLWVLMGTIMRMAQSQGLHRDPAIFGISPFEIEMRRRLWWYIIALDGRLTELVGQDSSLPASMDTHLPANVDDSDLEPGMSTSPSERPGPSEITFCLMRYEIARFLLDYDPWSDGTDGKEKRTLADLEDMLEEKFLRFCDPVVPVQFLTTTIVRSSLCKLRHLSMNRGRRAGAPTTREGSSPRLTLAARSIEYDNLIHANISLSCFFWHVDFHFPWGAPISILNQLVQRPDWEADMRAAWTQIEILYDHHPEYLCSDNVLHRILGGLTLKAWGVREGVLKSQSQDVGEQQHTPPMIAALKARHAVFTTQSKGSTAKVAGEDAGFTVNVSDAFDMMHSANLDFMEATFSSLDWSNWAGY